MYSTRCVSFGFSWLIHAPYSTQQRALSSSHICLLQATATGSESLKNLVLPGIREFRYMCICDSMPFIFSLFYAEQFTIVDDALVSDVDCTNNFFVSQDTIGTLSLSSLYYFVDLLLYSHTTHTHYFYQWWRTTAGSGSVRIFMRDESRRARLKSATKYPWSMCNKPKFLRSVCSGILTYEGTLGWGESNLVPLLLHTSCLVYMTGDCKWSWPGCSSTCSFHMLE